jgi:hypothetical protein
MITPPPDAKLFYSAFLEQDAAKFLVGLLAESFAHSDDVASALITSKDFDSDIPATLELQNGIEEISANIVDFDEHVEICTKYNPIYIPNAIGDIFDIAEFDDSGDVTSIDGFKSPYVIARTSVYTDEKPKLIEGSVTYKQHFELPPFFAIDDHQLLLS